MKKIYVFVIFFFLISSIEAEEKYNSYRETYLNKGESNSIKEDKALLNHEKCISAADYEGCMNYLNNSVANSKNRKNNIDCFNTICNPEEAQIYGTDNLGLKVIPGYYFMDVPNHRTATYVSKPFKIKVNDSYGRYIHIQTVFRGYFEGRSGSLSSTRGYNDFPNIIYRPGKPSGVRQRVYDYIFDCEEELVALFEGNKSKKLKSFSGRKKKWVDFKDGLNRKLNNIIVMRDALNTCKRPKEFILTLRNSRFNDLEKNLPKRSENSFQSKINCNSPVWKNKPKCN